MWYESLSEVGQLLVGMAAVFALIIQGGNKKKSSWFTEITQENQRSSPDNGLVLVGSSSWRAV
ncbi:hypothetical protein [Cypionkella sinensis]|uniref:Uncharacterized protein n=1 Tax=Cypionkella sinensis TaxID=1756043 RepID=A0ABV7IVW6_9RHOB